MCCIDFSKKMRQQDEAIKAQKCKKIHHDITAQRFCCLGVKDSISYICSSSLFNAKLLLLHLLLQ